MANCAFLRTISSTITTQRGNGYRERLDALDEEASQLRVPLGFTDIVYTLREHVNLVRRILEQQEEVE